MTEYYVVIKNIDKETFLSWVFKNGRRFKPNEIYIIEGQLADLLYDKKKIAAYKLDLKRGVYVKEVKGRKNLDKIIDQIKEKTFKSKPIKEEDQKVEKEVLTESKIVYDKPFSETDRVNPIEKEKKTITIVDGEDIKTVKASGHNELLNMQREGFEDSNPANIQGDTIVFENNGVITMVTDNIIRVKYDTGLYGTYDKPSGYKMAREFRPNIRVKKGETVFVKE